MPSCRDLFIVEDLVAVTVGGAEVEIDSHGYDFDRDFYLVEFSPPVEEDDTDIVVSGKYDNTSFQLH